MNYEELIEKSKYVRRETLKIHQRVSETRVASSLSPIEILVSLYYGNLIKFDPSDTYSDARDRFIISKGHGSICMYPLLADLGFFPKSELENACKGGSFLGGIPDPVIPGYETVNGSLGHGPGVASGMAYALKTQNKDQKVVVLTGDGELNEGAIWEAVMFAAHHGLDNLTLIVDNNKTSMLNRSENIVNLSPLSKKFEAFGWIVITIKEGNNIDAILKGMTEAKSQTGKGQPVCVLLETEMGNGVDFMMHTHAWHGKAPNDEQLEIALSQNAETLGDY